MPYQIPIPRITKAQNGVSFLTASVTMSFRARAAPWMIAGLLGVGSGVYIFDPLLRQYTIDSRGTMDPEIAQIGAAGGLGGGVNDASKIAEEADRKRKDKVVESIVKK
ncbi:hypothetical protein CBS101457_004779 [Exobasidium rhododendri]|nr:hypothetical protein CBS101457_004779 [Exobasidium rhododendri]